MKLISQVIKKHFFSNIWKLHQESLLIIQIITLIYHIALVHVWDPFVRLYLHTLTALQKVDSPSWI